MGRRRRAETLEPGPSTGEVLMGDAIVSGPSTAMVDDIISDMGEGIAVLADDGLSIHLPGVIPTGSEWLDSALGRGGWPLSRICLLGGGEGGGKTTLALQACVNVQRAGGIAAFIDAEHKLDRAYAAALGVDLKRLIMPPPKKEGESPMTVEESFAFLTDLSDRYLKSPAARTVPFLCVYDSISALLTDQEVEGKDALGSQSRAISTALKKINPQISMSAMCLLLLSQLRAKIGVTFGAKETTTGGNAPRFYSAVIAQIEPIQGIKDGAGRRIGHVLKVNVEKNQVGIPFRECKIAIRYGEGIDYTDSVQGNLKDLDYIETKGSWTRYIGPGAAEKGADGEIRWSGLAGLRTIQEERSEDFARLLAAIRETRPAL